MSFEPPAGILDIGNATLRVGKLEVAETTGLNQGLQNIVKNDLLITETDSYTTSKSWGLKLPTTWVAEFDIQGQTGKYVEFNFYNEGSTSNTQGYTLNFKDTSLTLKYDNGPEAGLATATIPTIVGTFRKVNIFFERGVIAVSIDGARVLYHKESDGFNNGLGVASRVVSTTGGAFLNAFIQSDHGGNSIFKNLRIVNGRFISDKTSNVSFIGSLGVGVNNPKESLDIRGNMHLTRVSNVSQISVDSNVVTEYTGPHDRPLRKYPEVALTSASDSGYVTSSSTTVGTYYTWKAFDNNLADDSSVWTTVDNIYDGANDFKYDSNKTLGGVSGEWLKIELPNKIKPSYVRIYPRTYSPPIGNNQSPEDFKILASNDDTSWDELASVVGWVTNATWGKWDISSNTYYKYFAIVCTRTIGAATFGLAELEYYGYEEGSGSLDTTLKSVYNVPATTGTQLEVYYDGQDFSGTPTSITDRSTNNITATANNITIDTTYKSFEITSSPRSNIIADNVSFASDDEAHTYALWVRLKNSQQRNLLIDYRPDGGTSTTGNAAGILLLDYNQRIQFYHQSADVEARYTFITNVWYHIICSYSGGGNNTTNSKIYINGVEQTNTYVPSGFSTSTLTLPTTGKLTIGDYLYASGYGMGDGNIGNVRLYSKALNADQVKELYDYQKDYFLGSKSQLTIYKGHLGVGVTEPSGQLELAGDERIQEYPPRAMDDYETLIPGHGAFVALGGNSSSYAPWKAFDKSTSTFWIDTGVNYSTTSPYGSLSTAPKTILYDGSVLSGGWIDLECPYPVKLKRVGTAPRTNYSSIGLQRGIILGSNNGVDWYQIDTIDYAGTTPPNTLTYFDINTDSYYSHFRLVCTNLTALYAPNGNPDMHWQMSELVYFGTPGPTTLDKGSLSLTRSLDVPRISRYDVDTETPRPEKLVVDFDTTVNSSPTDISGQGNHGTLVGATYSAADKAFNYVGTSGNNIKAETGFSGNQSHTVSLWFNPDAVDANQRILVFLSSNGGTDLGRSIIFFNTTTNGIAFDFRSKSIISATLPVVGQWMHLVCTYDSSNGTTKMYMDGVLKTDITEVAAATTINLVNGSLTIGSNNAGTEQFEGKISNFKIYNVALEPSEVRKLYNLGRTGRSMVISDTAVGIGKAPEAQLDVRGNLNVDGVLTTPQRPVFYAYNSTGADTAAGFTGHIQFIHTRINVGNCYNTSNRKFYAPVAGYYFFKFQVLARESTGGAGRVETTLYKNGVNISGRALAYTYLTGTSDHDNLAFSTQLYLEPGDSVYPVIHACDSNMDVYYGEDLGHFSGFFIG